MTTWVLTFILLGIPQSYQGGGFATSTVIEGFTTEQACRNYGIKLRNNSPGSNEKFSITKSYTCGQKSL